MNVRDTVSIITGRVRDEPRAIEVLRDLSEMRMRGLVDRIIIATWRDELARYPELGQLIDRANIEIVQMQAPEMSLQESHQKLPLLAALNFVGERSYVTRHRFDRVFPGPAFAEHMAWIKCAPPAAVIAPNSPFRHVVTVNSAMVDVPFFFGDFIFSGFRDDVATLLEINAHAELFRSPELNPEMTFFATPFLRQYPEVADYFATYPGMSYGRPDFDIALRAARRGADFYLTMFALHVYLATTHFNIGYGMGGLPPGGGKIDLDELLFSRAENSSIPGTFYFPLAGHLATKSGHIFGKIAAGNVIPSPLAERIVEKIAQFRDQGRMSTPFLTRTLSDAARSYAGNLAKHGIKDVPSFGSVTRNGRIIDYHLAQFANMTSALVRVNGSNEMSEWGEL